MMAGGRDLPIILPFLVKNARPEVKSTPHPTVSPATLSACPPRLLTTLGGCFDT